METQIVQNKAVAEKFPALVERLYAAHNPAIQGNNGTIAGAISNCFAQMAVRNNSGKREAFRDLLLLMYAKKCYKVVGNPGYIEILANMSAFANKAVNPINIWVKDSLVADGQLSSVIRHMFAAYEVPEFMEYAFAESNKIHMLWYIQLGRGESVKNLSAFPVVLTKKMAHAFRDTPKQFTITQAIRRAQAIGYGASGQMAEAVSLSETVEQLANKEFRALVVQFLAKYKGVVAFDVVEQALGYMVAMHNADADYSLKGRTYASVSREAAAYFAEEAKRKAAEMYNDWKPAKIGNYSVIKDSAEYSIIQLTNSEALYNEGYEMSHCVADYADDCAGGGTAIFSLRKFTAGDEAYETLATIEVCISNKTVVQAKAKYNEDISIEAEDHIVAWAGKE
ncbi:MAG: PcfJ domain-containing protein, partial [Bacteroidota bacterium]